MIFRRFCDEIYIEFNRNLWNLGEFLNMEYEIYKDFYIIFNINMNFGNVIFGSKEKFKGILAYRKFYRV